MSSCFICADTESYIWARSLLHKSSAPTRELTGKTGVNWPMCGADLLAGYIFLVC